MQFVVSSGMKTAVEILQRICRDEFDFHEVSPFQIKIEKATDVSKICLKLDSSILSTTIINLLFSYFCPVSCSTK